LEINYIGVFVQNRLSRVFYYWFLGKIHDWSLICSWLEIPYFILHKPLHYYTLLWMYLEWY